DSLFHFRSSIASGSHCFAANQLLEFTAVELDFGVVAACWSSPRAPLNSAWPKVSNLCFPVIVDQISVTVNRQGHFGGSASENQSADMDDNRA
ncbi:hypothetical protein CUMW_266200, partial [Citrus unshiu]